MTHPHRVTLISMGGTIAMTGDAETGVKPTLTASELAADVHDVASGVEITSVSFRSMPSASLALGDIVALASEIDRQARLGATAIVVTQGTDTIEETAFALDLLVAADVPVIVTGAMRNPNAPGADGPADLAASIAVATGAGQLGGVVVVVGDRVHAARHVAKRHSSLPSAFESPNFGELGVVEENRYVSFGRPTHSKIRLRPRADGGDPVVPMMTLGIGDDGLLLRAAIAADGAVVETMGGGHVPSWILDDLRALVAAVPTVVTSRTRAGTVLRSTYGFDGSERDVRATGAMTAGPLDAIKARVALMLGLSSGLDRSELVELFAQFETFE